MNLIDLLYQEDGSDDRFIYNHAVDLFSFVGKEPQLCYWLASCLEPAYMGECTFSLTPPWNKEISKEENKVLWTQSVVKIMQNTLEILSLCSGNLLNPIPGQLLIKNGLQFDKQELLGTGSFGSVYLIDGHAVKVVSFTHLDTDVSNLIRETTVLSMLGRLHLIGMNDTQFYIGTDYYPQALFDQHESNRAVPDLISELSLLHSLGVIHCDIKPDNIRIDTEGYCRLIDFGSCRFTPSSDPYGFIVTNAFCDYLLLKDPESHSFEIDIWSLGVVFYMLEKKTGPWTLSGEKDNYAKCIEDSYCTAMEDVSPLVKSMLALTKEERWKIL